MPATVEVSQAIRKPTCREYREEAARLGMSVWALREQDRQELHDLIRREQGKKWKPAARNERGFLIRRSKINGQWVESLEYPGKTWVEKCLRTNAEKEHYEPATKPKKKNKRR